MKKFKILLIVIFLAGTGLFGFKAYNEHKNHLEKQMRFMMDTFVSIYAIGPKTITSGAVSAALNRMEEVGVKFNSFDPKSPIYQFNNNNEAIADPEVLGLVRTALGICKESDGTFDITVAPLLELWGFYTQKYRVPSEQEVRDCLAHVGYRHLVWNGGKLEKDDPAIKIDLGGVAKGYALAEAIKVLKANGVVSAVIDVGGDVYAMGKKGKRLWRVGIKDPRGEGMLGYIEVEDLAVMGSGDYERFFIKDGKRYHHIFDPRTGYPTEGVMSVTLISSDPVLAQILAKMPFLLGPQKGLEMLGRVAGMEAIVITTSGERIYSPGLKDVLKVIPES